jgi:hypothetical protein
MSAKGTATATGVRLMRRLEASEPIGTGLKLTMCMIRLSSTAGLVATVTTAVALSRRTTSRMVAATYHLKKGGTRTEAAPKFESRRK